VALNVVLELALMMYRQLFLNDMGKTAVMVFFITLLNGMNTSFYLNWWPTFIFRSGRYTVKGESTAMTYVGGFLTLLVLLQYFGFAIAFFVYYGIMKEVANL